MTHEQELTNAAKYVAVVEVRKVAHEFEITAH